MRLELRNVAPPLTAAEEDQLKTLFTKMLDHQEAVLKILEENQADVGKTATALEAYLAKHGDEVKKVTATARRWPSAAGATL